MFSGLFMTAIAFISAFGLKQTRNQYLMTRKLYAYKGKEEEMTIESPESMKQLFQNEKPKV